jgi:hypothetical protein
MQLSTLPGNKFKTCFRIWFVMDRKLVIAILCNNKKNEELSSKIKKKSGFIS